MIARVRWQVPANVATGLTHMLVRVTVDGHDWLADAGMGSRSLTAPLAMVDGLEQETPHDRRRLVRRDDHFIQQTLFASEWHDQNLFRPEPAPAVDLELGNWYSHTHPQAHFRNNLMVARATADGRLSLLNREFSFRHHDDRTEQRELVHRRRATERARRGLRPALPRRNELRFGRFAVADVRPREWSTIGTHSVTLTAGSSR